MDNFLFVVTTDFQLHYKIFAHSFRLNELYWFNVMKSILLVSEHKALLHMCQSPEVNHG